MRQTNIKINVRKNKDHNILMMLMCCGLLLFLLFIIIYAFNLSKNYLVLLVPLICLITHYFMMNYMCKKHHKKNKGCCH